MPSKTYRYISIAYIIFKLVKNKNCKIFRHFLPKFVIKAISAPDNHIAFCTNLRFKLLPLNDDDTESAIKIQIW